MRRAVLVSAVVLYIVLALAALHRASPIGTATFSACALVCGVGAARRPG